MTGLLDCYKPLNSGLHILIADVEIEAESDQADILVARFEGEDGRGKAHDRFGLKRL
ncbi:hypothetical protein DIZ76_017216 [Coccidioides immitis]|nr:hypothetical protein DIZ76_017216 [Coccidioides immitis]